jgi:hypothetical protein
MVLVTREGLAPGLLTVLNVLQTTYEQLGNVFVIQLVVHVSTFLAVTNQVHFA